jgi:TP901 family phage tail tape measure protein
MADANVVSQLVVQGAQQFIADYLKANEAVVALTTTLTRAERIRTPQLAPQIAQVSAALDKARASGQQFVGSLAQVNQATQQVTQSSSKKTQAIDEQSRAEGRAKSSGITYLSVLSAIHAASFLASSRTFTLIGSFTTLGLAFGKMGLAAAGAGLALGGFLVIFQSINNAAALIQQALLGVIAGLGKLAAVAGVALAGAGVAGTKIAADLEQQFALIQAVSGAPASALRELLVEVNRVAERFGVAATQVAEGASLFIRAGGDIETAMRGGAEAITQLVVASAGELQAAQAAVAISAGLNQFNLAATESVRVANALAGAAQASALSFTGVTQAFIQAAPGAVTLGISLEDLAATIALLGNELVKGTITGTGLKQVILDLINPSRQAREVLNQYGISVRDSAGNIRPFIDIVDDMNKALGDEAVERGRVTAAARAQALAVVFGSRAGLAANILTREGAQAISDYRAELEKTTAVDIANVLLLPLNKQLEILRVNAERAGQAFGAPLLQPIRNATVEAIKFVQGLVPIAQLAGQAISVLVSGQGFGKLQEEISKVADPRVAVFFIELVNVGRNVADVIQNQIIPAIIDFVVNIGLVSSESGRLTDVATSFANVNRAIQTIGAVIAGVIRALGQFTAELIHNEGRGKEFRDTITNIATVLITNLVTSLAVAAAGVVLAIQVMAHFGNVLRTVVLPNIEAVANGFIAFADVYDKVLEIVAAGQTVFVRAGATAAALLRGAGIDEALEEGARAAEAATFPIIRLSRHLVQGARDATKAFKAIADGAKSGFLGDDGVEGILKGAQAQAQNTIKSFENIAGSIPDLISNLRQNIDAAAETTRRGITGSVGAVDLVDPKAIESAKRRIEEAGRDVARRLANIQEDTSTRLNELQSRALERIGDVFEKANEQLAELARDTKERIDDLRENVTQRRADRAATQSFQKDQEDRLRLVQRAFDAQELIEKRHTEDVERGFDRQQDAAERVYSRTQQAAEVAFKNIQAAQERALGKTQDAEEKALRSKLDKEAREREEAKELAAAKTPAEQADVRARQAQARHDREFEEKQQVQLDALRQRHEDTRLAFQQGQEAQQLAFRNSQEDQALAFRLKAENKSIEFRRKLEDEQLPIKLRREDELLAIRRANEAALIKFQDELEDAATERQIARINREAQERQDKIAHGALRQVQEIQEQLALDLIKQENDLQRALRGVAQTFGDAIDGLEAPIRSALAPLISGILDDIEQKAADIGTQFEIDADKLRALVSTMGIIGEGNLNINRNQTVTPVLAVQAQTIGTLTALSFVVPPSFVRDISDAVRQGIADLHPELQSTVDLTPIVDAIEDVGRDAWRRR